MQYVKQSTITIPRKRWEKVDIHLFNRFLEMFGINSEVEVYMETWDFPSKKDYLARNSICEKWVISIADYKEFLDWLIKNLPTKYSKKEAKKILPIIDIYMGPKTFELAELEKNNKINPNEQPITNEIQLDTSKG